MVPEQYAIWLRLVFAGPAVMNPWFQFWLNAMVRAEEYRTAPEKPLEKKS